LSPITVGLALSLLVVAGAAVHVRSRGQRDRASQVEPERREPRESGVVAAGSLLRTPRWAAPEPHAADDGTKALLDEWRRGQRGPRAREAPALIEDWRRYRLLRQADEKAFERLELDGKFRAAIRKIDGQHRPRSAPPLVSTPGIPTSEGEMEAARRAAIDALLGAELASAFYSAETAAIIEVPKE
jgi:Ni/Co efflux regulator RcnB